VEEFHIADGGPFQRLERAAHVQSVGRLVVVSIAITWIPLVVLALIGQAIDHEAEPLLRDFTIHAELLVTLPLLLVADRVLDLQCEIAVRRLFAERFVTPAASKRVRAVLGHASRMRDAAAPEIVLFAIALGVGVAGLLGAAPHARIFYGVLPPKHAVLRAWCALVSLPIFQFVLWRSLFRWALWARVLFGIARAPIALVPIHADRRGGISFLKWPSVAYCALLLFAVSAALCGRWATRIAVEGTKADAFKPLFYAFVLIGVVVALAPLCAFVPKLLAARRDAREQYGGLVADYGRALAARWFDRPRRSSELLGSPDFQSFADISSSFRENVEKMSVLLFGVPDAVALLVVAALPAIPLVLSQASANEILRKLLHLVTGLR